MSIGRAGPPLFTILVFWAFVLGGLVFGAIFVSNWRVLAMRVEATPRAAGAPPPSVRLAAGPVSVTLPVTASAPQTTAAAPAKASSQVASSIASVVKTVLPDWQGTDRVNVLLLGIDKRDDEPIEGTRSDTMMLASIDPVSKSAALVSLPRDMWVNIPGCGVRAGCSGGQQRINVAHAVGGPEMAMQTVTADFGIPLQYYARVDFRGFEQMINAVGGVAIDVDWPVKDDEYPTADYGYMRIYFGPGPQLMDGAQALEYARSRHGMNDFARAGRQQKVILAVRNRVLQMDMLSRAPELAGIAQQSVSTNLSPVQMLALAKLVSQIDHERITNLVIDASYVRPFVGDDGADLLDPDIPAIKRAIANAERTAAHPELRARVEVLNGSGTAGLGQRAADFLSAQGFNVVRIAAAERTDYTSSVVQVLGSDTSASARALAEVLRMPESAISMEPTDNPTADIRIVVGRDFRVPTS
ncbi:MAG: LCP family protein [Chloroflexi bacterium]|nr:LCP family protein [Chloroflexota bacterium]MBV9132575.1 LCP family protein [Chloroflexota bacterium]MBV9896214.1 LCP family protein [Chloroflexota bacterium]